MFYSTLVVYVVHLSSILDTFNQKIISTNNDNLTYMDFFF